MTVRKKVIMLDHAHICIVLSVKSSDTVNKCRKNDISNNSSVKVGSSKGATGGNDDTYAFKAVSWNKHYNYPGVLVDTGAIHVTYCV